MTFHRLRANPTKWSNTLKQFVGNSRTFCGSALKGLKESIRTELGFILSNCSRFQIYVFIVLIFIAYFLSA